MEGTATPLLTEWRTWQLGQGLALRTVDERQRLMTRFGADAATDIVNCSHSEIVEWMAAHDGTHGRAWSVSTRSTYHSVLAAWFGWLVKMGHRIDNPMIKVGTPRVPARQPRPVPDEHLPRLMSTRMHRRTWVMLHLAAYAGLRVHEIAKIRGEDFDLLARTLSVRGKGGKLVRMPIAGPLVEIAATMPARGWWFPSPRGEGPIKARSVSAMISQVMRRAGAPGTAHALRHWYGTTLVDDGADLRVVQELLRHASLATTQIYTKVSDARRREAVERLDIMRALRANPPDLPAA